MPELIDKAKLLEYLAAIKPDEYVSAYGEAAVDVINHVETYVAEMTTIEAEPVRHGRQAKQPTSSIAQNAAETLVHSYKYYHDKAAEAWNRRADNG